MKRILYIILISLFTFSCTDELYEFPDVTGQWILVEYNVAEGFDINMDGEVNVNLLQELDCLNDEILTFDVNGVVTSINTFNPSINVSLVEEGLNDYVFDIICDNEGSIGIATSYAQQGENINFNGAGATIINEELQVVYKDAFTIKDFNSDEVIETYDITMVYTKL